MHAVGCAGVHDRGMFTHTYVYIFLEDVLAKNILDRTKAHLHDVTNDLSRMRMCMVQQVFDELVFNRRLKLLW